MRFKQKKKYISFFALLVLISTGTLSQSAWSAISQQKKLYITITAPAPNVPFAHQPEQDIPLLPAVETFPVNAIAQPQTAVNLYAWNIIPGTDGNTNPDTTITNFTAEVSGSNILFQWQPRTIFTEQYRDQALYNTNRSCTAQQAAGVVPSAVNCMETPSNGFYHGIVHSDELNTNDNSNNLLDLLLPDDADIVEQWQETINSTALDDSRCQAIGSCQGCEYDYFLGGWVYSGGKMANNDTLFPAIRTASGGPMSYDSFNVDVVNGNVPSINGIGQPWEKRLILPEQYVPNVARSDYSGVHVFSYKNFIRAYNDNITCTFDPAEKLTFSLATFEPIRDRVFLVDDFRQYEIYMLSENEYPQYEGITRENGTLIAVVKNPSTAQIEVPTSALSIPAGEAVHFAIFEVRSSGHTNIPERLQEPIIEKEALCFDDPTALICPAVKGQTLSSNQELVFDSGSFAQARSPQKGEWQIFEQEGEYTAEALRTNTNGELKCGVNNNEQCRFAKTVLNRFARNHFLFGTYGADDTTFSSENKNTLSVRTNRAVGTKLNPYSLNAETTQVRSAENLYGVVFNSYTHEILSNVTVELTGTTAENNTSVRLTQQTSRDGIFALEAEQGTYTLNVLQLVGTAHTFVFPASDYVANGATCGDDGIFTNIYCDILSITVQEESVQRAVALTPPIRGMVTGSTERVEVILTNDTDTVVANTFTLSNEKFSFFVSPGTYTISEIRDLNGNVLKTPQQTVTISAAANGHPQPAAELSLSL